MPNCIWRDSGVAVNRIAINVSGRQFRQAGFAKLVESVLRSTGTLPTALSMEITENVLVDTLKIDRAFIATIDAAERGGVIAKLVLDMAGARTEYERRR